MGSNSEEYYGNTSSKTRTVDKNNNKINLEGEYNNSICKQIVVILTSLLGLLSVLALIALNVANLAEIYRTKTDSNQLMNLGTEMKDSLKSLQSDISDDIKPKTNLINTATSFRIPTLISAHTKLLQNDIVKFCSPKYDISGKDCPISMNPFHSGLFNLYDPGTEQNCVQQNLNPFIDQNFTFLEFASFIPSPTRPQGCSRIPTFSLSHNIYSYSHNQIREGCGDASASNQFWTLGRIVAGDNNKPVFLNLVNWLFTDNRNRKSCSTAAGSQGAWLACTIVTSTEREDYLSEGISPLFIAYQDVYGKRKEWYFQENQIWFDRPYDALYFSVGSGVVIRGRVYFLAYGCLRTSDGVDAYCIAPGCDNPNPNQTACNEAQRPAIFSNKQVVNAIVDFDDNINQKPSLRIRTIPTDQYDIGAEGRLYHFESSDITYIYKRSTAWHSLIFFGEIDLPGSLQIKWYPINTFSRPGNNVCSAANRCPTLCVTGVYTDYYPLNLLGNLGISVILRSQIQRINPTIRIATRDQGLAMYSIFGANQRAAYTMTTCFKFDAQIWCLSIIEMAPGTLGSFQPVSLLYPINYMCAPSNALDISNQDEGSGDDEGLIFPDGWRVFKVKGLWRTQDGIAKHE